MKRISLLVLPVLIVVVVTALIFAGGEGGATMTDSRRPLPAMDLPRDVNFETATFSLG